MDYELTSSISQDILKITLSGKGGKEKASEITLKVTELVKTFHPKALLIDVQSMQNRLDSMTTYNLIHTYPQELPHLKTAVVDRKENDEISRFYETVSENAGYITRYFTDEEAAREWLQS